MINFFLEEKLYAIIRRHRITLALQISLVLIFAVLILVGIAFLNNNYPNILNSYGWYVSFILSIYYASLWLKLFIIIADYYLDVSIITSHRLISIEQIHFFNREVTEFPLERIQDIMVRVNGPLETLLDYGDIIIRTASETQTFDFEKIPQPYKIKDLILNLLHNKFSQQHEKEYREGLR